MPALSDVINRVSVTVAGNRRNIEVDGVDGLGGPAAPADVAVPGMVLAAAGIAQDQLNPCSVSHTPHLRGIDEDDVALVLTELVTNAVEHARSPLTVTVGLLSPHRYGRRRQRQRVHVVRC
jgi:signal transduction histidine kinase